jgi:hypothetical protein
VAHAWPGHAAFEVELAFEGLVDGLDDLAQGFEEPGAGPGWLALAGRAQQAYSGTCQGCFEVAPVVVRRVVSRERPHSTGVESATHTSSAHRLVPAASARISQPIVAASLRSRLL